ncbi:MAG: hypothetical protein ACRDXC_03805 [Acidimicrobiales bacterium]
MTLLGTGALAAACGGSSPGQGVASLGNSTTTTTAPSATQSGRIKSASSRAIAFVNCMHKHGDTSIPDPTIDGSNIAIRVNKGGPQFAAAYTACKHLMPNNGAPTGATITPADHTDYLRGAACMRSHGFPSFPDPVFQNNSVTFNVPSSIDRKSPAYESAVTTCEKLIPPGLPYSSPSDS